MADRPPRTLDGEGSYRRLLRTSPAPINLFDADGTTVWGNDAVLDLLGLEDRSELVGRSIFDFIHPDHHEVARSELTQVIGGDEPVGPTPMKLVTADGETLSIRVSTAPGRYRGEPIGQAIVIDDTPLVEAQEALQQQRDLVERVIDTLPDLYFMLSREGELLDWNDQVAEVTGYDDAELGELAIAELLSPADAGRLLDSMSTMLAEGQDMVEVQLLTREGRPVPYEFHGGLLTNGGETPPRIVGIARNVADREERNRHLRVVDRLLRHNLRNKLNVVMGYAELARDEDADLREEHVEEILRTARRLLDSMEKEREIVNVIVDPGPRKPLDLGTILAEEVGKLRSDHPEAAVALDGADAGDVLAITSLRRAVAEVLDNAVRHNADGEPGVEVRVDAGDGEVAVHVDDDGPAIPGTEQQVFADLTEASLAHSEGLGLWFVHWVLDRSGGRLELSRCADGGNRVTLWLPTAEG